MKKYLQVFKINFLTFLEYRTDLFISFLIKLSIFAAFVLVWGKIVAEGNTISGYGLTGIAFYYLAAQMLDAVRTSQTATDFRTNIIRGELSAKLVKPLNIITYFFSKHVARVLSETLMNSSFVVPIFVFWSTLFTQLSLNLVTCLEFLLLWTASVIFDYVLFLTVGQIAFWTKEASGLQILVKNSTKLFAGDLIPLDILPLGFQKVINFSPFPYTLFLPIKVLMGQVSTQVFLNAICILSAWILLFLILNFLLWKKGLHQYESVGI